MQAKFDLALLSHLGIQAAFAGGQKPPGRGLSVVETAGPIPFEVSAAASDAMTIRRTDGRIPKRPFAPVGAKDQAGAGRHIHRGGQPGSPRGDRRPRRTRRIGTARGRGSAPCARKASVARACAAVPCGPAAASGSPDADGWRGWFYPGDIRAGGTAASRAVAKGFCKVFPASSRARGMVRQSPNQACSRFRSFNIPSRPGSGHRAWPRFRRSKMAGAARLILKETFK
jgi:hypothetical protein